jgi:ABC-type transport system substrate-binding protein
VNYLELSKAEVDEARPVMPTARGIIGFPISGNLSSLDPSLSITMDHAVASSVIYETLTRLSEEAMIIPWLASSFQGEEGGRRFRFHLREGVRFHDGKRLTARDVRYSFERVLQNQACLNRSFLEPIRGAKKLISAESRDLEGFRIISALEFVIELERPLSFFPAILASEVISIVPENNAKFGATWREGSVGTGPFRLTSFEPGRSLKLEANPGYWRAGYPKSDGVEITIDSSPSEIMTGFRNRRFAIAWNLFPSDVETLRHESELAANYREVPILSTYYISMNIHREPLNDENVRRKLKESLDQQQLVKKNTGGLAIPAYSLSPPGLLGYDPEAKHPAQILHDKHGKEEYELKVVLHSVFEGQYASLAKDVFSAFQDAGFKIKVVETKGELFNLNQLTDAHLNFSRWFADYPDIDSFMNTLLQSTTGFEGPFLGMPELDQLVEKGRAEANPATRHSIYREIEEILQKRALLIPLFHEKLYAFFHPKVEGMELNFFAPYFPLEKLSIRQ